LADDESPDPAKWPCRQIVRRVDIVIQRVPLPWLLDHGNLRLDVSET
jgi:hypothetical protein